MRPSHGPPYLVEACVTRPARRARRSTDDARSARLAAVRQVRPARELRHTRAAEWQHGSCICNDSIVNVTGFGGTQVFGQSLPADTRGGSSARPGTPTMSLPFDLDLVWLPGHRAAPAGRRRWVRFSKPAGDQRRCAVGEHVVRASPTGRRPADQTCTVALTHAHGRGLSVASCNRPVVVSDQASSSRWSSGWPHGRPPAHEFHAAVPDIGSAHAAFDRRPSYSTSSVPIAPAATAPRIATRRRRSRDRAPASSECRTKTAHRWSRRSVGRASSRSHVRRTRSSPARGRCAGREARSPAPGGSTARRAVLLALQGCSNVRKVLLR